MYVAQAQKMFAVMGDQLDDVINKEELKEKAGTVKALSQKEKADNVKISGPEAQVGKSSLV